MTPNELTAEEKADLIVHPVRLRLLQAMAGAELTVNELRERLPDIPRPTIYRHLARLTTAGLTVVIRERPVRGVPERTYALSGEALMLTSDETRAAGPERMRRAVQLALGLVTGDIQRYLATDAAAPDEPIGASQHIIVLTDAQVRELQQAIFAILDRPDEQSEDARRWKFSLFVLPD